MTGELVAGRYRMKRRIGAGGMAAVFLAKDCRLERDVAIKRLHADSPEDVGQRFQREAKLGASLNHPNIVSVYDTVTDDEGVLIVMEYVAGHTLRDEIARGPMDPARALESLSAIASALDHAHGAGVVHRDVKPANVLIDDARGVCKLADLGIATAAERTRITASGSVLGTAAYMPPERLDGRPGGPPVDIYALAAMGFEMLSGRKAIVGSTPLEIARRVATEPPPDLRDVVADAPEQAAEALKRGLAKEPEDRPATAGELVAALAEAYAAKVEEERSKRATAVVAAPVPEAEPATRPEPEPEPRAERASTNGHAPVAAATEPPATERPATATGYTSAGATTSPRVHRGTRRPRWLAPAGILALVVAVLAGLAIVVASTGGSDSAGEQSVDSGSEQREPSSGGSGTAGESEGSAPETTQPDAGGGSATPAPAPDGSAGTTAPDPSTPSGAVAAFYGNAADANFKEAWALASPNARRALVSYDAFVRQQTPLKSIEFPSLKVQERNGDSAVVSFRSIARLETKTDRCRGTIDVVQGGGGWLVDDFHVTCSSGPPS